MAHDTFLRVKTLYEYYQFELVARSFFLLVVYSHLGFARILCNIVGSSGCYVLSNIQGKGLGNLLS